MVNYVGRPPVPLADRKVSRSVSITAATADFLRTLGGGNLSLGITRAVQTLEAQKGAALAAIKAAAEARDQTRVSENAFD